MGPEAASPIVTKPCDRCPHSATMPRTRIAAFIAASPSYDGGCRGARVHRAVGSGEAIGDAQVVFRMWDVGVREELAAGQHGDTTLARGANESVGVDIVGKCEPDVVAAFGN